MNLRGIEVQRKQVILFMVTNGVGLGHMTRGLAIAKRVKQLRDDVEIIFLSTSLATEVIRDSGFNFYYVPTRAIMPNNMTAIKWNQYLRKQIEHIIEFHDPVALVYDGAVPSSGLFLALKDTKLKRIWIKRECYKRDTKEDLDIIENLFDLVVLPKELSNEIGEDRSRRKCRACHPIVLLDEEEAYSRVEVRNALDIKDGQKLFYVQLGSGRINLIDDLINQVIELILENQQNFVLLGESIIGDHIEVSNPRVKVIRDYPNARYFKGIDAAVSAAGYNTFHELIYFGVPSLFIPNTKTALDDQTARVNKLVNQQGCLIYEAECNSRELLRRQINKLVEKSSTLSMNSKQSITQNGALEAARYILEVIE